MTKTEKIDSLLSDLANKKLSSLLPIMLSLSLEYQDYVGFCIFAFWGKPMMAQSEKKMDFDDVEKSLEEAGISDTDTRRTILCDATEKYLSSRTVEKDKINVSTVQELEDQMTHYTDMMNACDTPQNLHPTDLYFRSAENDAIRSKLIAAQLEREKQYAILRSLIAEKLNLYRVQAMKEERKQFRGNILKSNCQQCRSPISQYLPSENLNQCQYTMPDILSRQLSKACIPFKFTDISIAA